MDRRWLLVFFVALLLTAACGGSDDDNQEEQAPTATVTAAPAAPTLPPVPTRVPQPTSTPVTSYEAGTRTGIEVIDAALATLESGDAEALTQQLSFHPYRCDNAPAGTVGSNPCPPGVSEGSAVDVIAAGDCEVQFLARDRAGLIVVVTSFVQAAAGQGLYAVVEVQEGRLASPLPFRYLVILSDGYTVLLDDAGITHLSSPCEGVGATDLYHPADTEILPPQ